MTLRKHLIHIRLNDSEYLKITRNAEAKQVTVAEIIRDLIKKMPDTK